MWVGLMAEFWLPALVGGVVSLLAPLLLRPMLRQFGIVDVPNERSSHTAPTLRAGGIAQLVGVITGLVVCLTLPLSAPDRLVLVVVLTGGSAAAVVGLTDDLATGRGVTVLIRGGAELVIGLAAGAALVGRLGGGVWAAFGIGFLVAAYINMANFMDGVNGISGAHGAIVGVAYSAIGLLAGLPWLVLAGLLLAAVFLAFLPWNLLGAGMFLGDVGSYLLGATIAGCAAGAILAGVPWLSALAPLAVYVADTLVTLVRRTWRGEPIFRAHRIHAYQRLTNTGLSHLQVTAIVSLFTIVTAVPGILMLAGIWPVPLAAAAILLTTATYVVLPRWRDDRLPARDSAPLATPPYPAATPVRLGFEPRRWALVGASGFIGQAIADDLRGRGLEVVSIPAPRVRLDPALVDGSRVASVAMLDPAVTSLSSRLAGADVVVNAAGLATPDAPASAELYGANALLPAIIGAAVRAAGVPRLIHISSAAVQGRRPVLDETAETAPFSPYSRSKALGESALLTMAAQHAPGIDPDFIIVRATSVQGTGRSTTVNLRRIAHSPLASVAAPGTQPSVVSSLPRLVGFVRLVGSCTSPLSPVLLQPWEGLSTSDVIRLAGGREPWLLPAWLCSMVLAVGRRIGQVIPEVAGLVRRMELLWLGQRQAPGTLEAEADQSSMTLHAVLEGRASWD